MYELRLLAGNGYTQELTAYEKTRLVERTKAALIRAKEEDGLEIQGKMRDLVAAMINESSTNVARMDAINNNATPEIKEQLKEGNLGITAAYEAAKLDEDEQKEIAEKAAAGENVRAKEIAEKVAEKKAGDDYETPHPESITSLCYSCQKYKDCNVKTGTCQKCDQYINKAEADMGDYGNVQKAYNKARKCKRHRKDVLIFTKDKEENLDKVREDILNLAYEPSEYHYFKVYEPKERQIMALPFYDRVVQHAINNVLEPIFDKRFISQSYACRKGKGMHAASDTLKEWLYEWNKYHPDQPLYAIKADIHHYFQSIDHAVLKTEIRKVIKDAGVLALLDRIIDHNGNMPDGVGIPVGNLTSQLFANIYLDALDQFIKHELGVEAYIRYMDDFVILSPDKEQLRSWLARIEQFLREELKLEFNPKTTILAAKNGIDFVGYKHRATHRKVRKDSIKRIKRTIKKCESGKITTEQLQKSIQSWTGHAGHADSYNLRKKIETLAEAAIEKAA